MPTVTHWARGGEAAKRFPGSRQGQWTTSTMVTRNGAHAPDDLGIVGDRRRIWLCWQIVPREIPGLGQGIPSRIWQASSSPPSQPRWRNCAPARESRPHLSPRDRRVPDWSTPSRRRDRTPSETARPSSGTIRRSSTSASITASASRLTRTLVPGLSSCRRKPLLPKRADPQENSDQRCQAR